MFALSVKNKLKKGGEILLFFIRLVSEYSIKLVSIVHSPNKNHHFDEAIGEGLLWFLVIWLTCNRVLCLRRF
jgi:hypothetical protein